MKDSKLKTLSCIIVRMAKTTKWLNAILDYMKKAKLIPVTIFCSVGDGDDAVFDQVIGHIQEIIFGIGN